MNSKKVKWEPIDWIKQYENIELMRKDKNAPVDIVGCESLSRIDEILSEKVWHV
jgi:S-methylmethionine-dependent homocysteine/selenocysteine methylase